MRNKYYNYSYYESRKRSVFFQFKEFFKKFLYFIVQENVKK